MKNYLFYLTKSYELDNVIFVRRANGIEVDRSQFLNNPILAYDATIDAFKTLVDAIHQREERLNQIEERVRQLESQLSQK